MIREQVFAVVAVFGFGGATCGGWDYYCQGGHAVSCNLEGLDRAQREDHRRAVQYYALACREGIGIGCRNVGNYYRRGIEVGQNGQTALRYMARGCHLQAPLACREAAEMLQAGELVERNEQLAHAFLENAEQADRWLEEQQRLEQERIQQQRQMIQQIGTAIANVATAHQPPTRTSPVGSAATAGSATPGPFRPVGAGSIDNPPLGPLSDGDCVGVLDAARREVSLACPPTRAESDAMINHFHGHGLPCERDGVIMGAIAECWAAACATVPADRPQLIAQAHRNLASAQSLCSAATPLAPGSAPCTTVHIAPCPFGPARSAPPPRSPPREPTPPPQQPQPTGRDPCAGGGAC